METGRALEGPAEVDDHVVRGPRRPREADLEPLLAPGRPDDAGGAVVDEDDARSPARAPERLQPRLEDGARLLEVPPALGCG
jgi:hypothetical protein